MILVDTNILVRYFTLGASVTKCVAGFLLLASIAFVTFAAAPPASQPVASQPAVDTSSPEAAIRSFLRAMFQGDKASGEACILPNAESDILWKSDDSQRHPAESQDFLKSLEFRRFKVGETYKLPGGKSVTFDENWIRLCLKTLSSSTRGS
jgi:hypothetical protein